MATVDRAMTQDVAMKVVERRCVMELIFWTVVLSPALTGLLCLAIEGFGCQAKI